MSNGLRVTIERTRENAEDGYTAFAITLGYMTWHLELHELAQLFSSYRNSDQEQLLMLKIGDQCEVILTASIVEVANVGVLP